MDGRGSTGISNANRRVEMEPTAMTGTSSARLTQQHSTALSTRQKPEKPRIPRASRLEALEKIQEAKGQWYTVVLERSYSTLAPDKQRKKVEQFITSLACLFDDHDCDDEAVRRVVNRCIKEEFRGTAYSPLPDIGALTRVIEDVLRSMVPEQPPIMPQPAGQRFLTQDEIAERFAEFWRKHG